ncbi:AAA family ATPase [Novosphingobium sp. NDB2Meth1]|uniref:AAA family ATPase n=1 Tax=Novosphingobium sp. NDB2Meth1 TaxID=1892847 RepID=UPI000931DDE1|nr:AAA family ATPase [Novosphingobium sp. NDB2Meth1]
MREAEFSAWLRAGGAQSEKAIDGRIASLRRIERNLDAMGFSGETLEEIYAQDQFAGLLEKLSDLRADARGGGLEFRLLLPESNAGDRRLSYWQSWLKRYGRFLAGEVASQAVANPELDAFLNRLSREEIEAAIEECDELGVDEFLLAHSFGKPRRWILDEAGADRYPAKAVVAAAISYLSDGPDLTSQTFYQGFGEDKAFSKLEELGYAITPPLTTAPANAAVAGLTRDAVLAAMEECDSLGLENFLTLYGFGVPRDYWLAHPENDHRYPAKAIVGVAHRHMPGGKTKPGSDFSGGNGPQGANTILRKLGFEIVGSEEIYTPPLRMSDQIRQHVIEAYIDPARTRGDSYVEVVSGDVHREMGLENAMPNVCQVLDGKILADEAGVVLINREGPQRSSTVRYRFQLGRKVADTPIWLVTALEGKEDGLAGFVERGDWHLLYDSGSKNNRMVREMQPGDRIVMRDFLANQRNPPFPTFGTPVTAMRIRATGVVTRASTDGLSVGVDWTVLPEARLWWLYTHNSTIWRLPISDSDMAQQLAAFIFNGAEQDMAWFLAKWDFAGQAQQEQVTMAEPTNLILYGPPGTGKTYSTAREAVRLCDGQVDFPDDTAGRMALMARYRALVEAKRIAFVTFHQNFGYEDFVEGLRPVTGFGEGVSTSGGGFSLEPHDGIFKQIATLAQVPGVPKSVSIEPSASPLVDEDVTMFRMSLGDASDPRSAWVFDQSIADGCAIFGFADVDWSDPKFEDAGEILAELQRRFPEDKYHAGNGAVESTNLFRNVLQRGDVIVVSRGRSKFRAIGIVDGDYEYAPRETSGYHHRRKVNWLWHDPEGLPTSMLRDRQFPINTISRLDPGELNLAVIDRLINGGIAQVVHPPLLPHVLIIDEINRANISKVFGELITLLEPDKRLGQPNALTVRLPYSKAEFGVPANLHIIGTMNTADRSIALLDTALRRRFTFREMAPDPALLKPVDGIDLKRVLNVINQRIEYLVDREHRIGHAFFMGLTSREAVDAVMRDKVIPLLQEYFFEDWSRIRAVLGDGFIGARKLQPPPGMSGRPPLDTYFVRWNEPAYPDSFPTDAYVRLLSGDEPSPADQAESGDTDEGDPEDNLA